VEDLAVAEQLPVRRRDLRDDVPEVVVPALVGGLRPVDRERRGGVRLRLDVVPDVRSAAEAGHIPQSGRPDLIGEVGPDRGVSPVVLRFRSGKEPEVEEGPFHWGLLDVTG
jgi:hypothetical protein